MTAESGLRRPEAHDASYESVRAPRDHQPPLVSESWPSPTLVVTEGHGLGDVTGESGVRVAMVTNSHAHERATRLVELYERSPDTFVPPRSTLGSFVIVDQARRRCLLGRDRTAVQHLYSAWDGDTLAVSTRIQPFMSSLCRRLDPIGVELFLAFGTLAPFPLYEGLHALPTGHWLEVDSSDHRVLARLGSHVLGIEPTEVPDNYERAVERYGELFLASIERPSRVVSGSVPVGGSDGACVLGALVQLGADIQAVHMHTEGQIGATIPSYSRSRGPSHSISASSILRPMRETGWSSERVHRQKPCGLLRDLPFVLAPGAAARPDASCGLHGLQR